MFSRFKILASLVSVNEYVAVSTGRKSAQLIVQADNNTLRVDLYNESTLAEALALHPGTKLAITGRITGRQNDRGYFNYSLYADDFVAIPESPKTTTQQQPAATPPPAPMADEDIPF